MKTYSRLIALLAYTALCLGCAKQPLLSDFKGVYRPKNQANATDFILIYTDDSASNGYRSEDERIQATLDNSKKRVALGDVWYDYYFNGDTVKLTNREGVIYSRTSENIELYEELDLGSFISGEWYEEWNDDLGPVVLKTSYMPGESKFNVAECSIYPEIESYMISSYEGELLLEGSVMQMDYNDGNTPEVYRISDFTNDSIVLSFTDDSGDVQTIAQRKVLEGMIIDVPKTYEEIDIVKRHIYLEVLKDLKILANRADQYMLEQGLTECTWEQLNSYFNLGELYTAHGLKFDLHYHVDEPVTAVFESGKIISYGGR